MRKRMSEQSYEGVTAVFRSQLCKRNDLTAKKNDKHTLWTGCELFRKNIAHSACLSKYCIGIWFTDANQINGKIK